MHEVKEIKSRGKVPEEVISKKSLDIHIDKLYAGYVKKRNELEEKAKTVDKTKAAATYSEFGEIKRQEPFNANGAILHEIFFAALGGDGKPGGKILKKIKADFGSFERWREDFVATAMASRGWVVLAFDFSDGRLHNYLVDFHHFGAVWGCVPLLVLDVFEHAYMMDYGAARKDYLEKVMGIIDWQVVNETVERAGLF